MQTSELAQPDFFTTAQSAPYQEGIEWEVLSVVCC